MNPKKSKELYALTQSIWYDNISRILLEDGTLKKYIDDGVIYGVTTNPAIFAKAIPQSVYDGAIAQLAKKDFSVQQIYDSLTVEDVQSAADLFRPLYESTNYLDGYVSLEVSPDLAHDTEGTISDVIRLAAYVDRPNVMFKIPGTEAGVPAIRHLVAKGFCINVTLLFDVTHYEAIARAYIEGIEEFIANGGNPARVNSVASIFVSRIDALVDKQLASIGSPEAAELKGKAGIAVMKEAYCRYNELFSGEKWGELSAKGARVQRILWASTSAKDPAFSPVKYIDELIAPTTVNTVPPATLESLAEMTVPQLAFSYKPDFSELSALAKIGVDIREACSKLQSDGVVAFQESFEGVLNVLKEKIDQFK